MTYGFCRFSSGHTDDLGMTIWAIHIKAGLPTGHCDQNALSNRSNFVAPFGRVVVADAA